MKKGLISQFTSFVLIISLMIPNVSIAGNGVFNCNTGMETCEKNGVKGNDGANGYCEQIEMNKKGCQKTAALAVSYTAMAIVCAIPCAAPEYGAALIPVCTFGSMAVSLEDLAFSIAMKKEVSGYITGIVGGTRNAFLTVQTISAASGNGFFSAFTNPVTLKGQGKSSGTCLSTVLNAASAAMQWVNKGALVKNSKSTEDSLKMLLNNNLALTQKPNNNNSLANLYSGSTSSPTTADSRSDSRGAPEIDDLSTSNLADSYAMAADGKYFSKNPNDFKKALEALQKETGITPEGIAKSLEANGVGGTLAKALGNSEKGKEFGKILQDYTSKLTSQDSTGLAYESSNHGSGAVAAKSDPFGDLANGLGGNRGPASGTKVTDVSFSHINGDIWHTGSPLSIFEIVSKKTQTVSGRVGK